MSKIEITVGKDEENERQIPDVWRSTFSNVVDAFAKKDYSLSCGVAGVSSVSNEMAIHIEEYIQDYGEELMPLPDEAWETSMCIWMEGHWDVLIDLWTVGEGRSDLVLGAKVSEKDNSYIIDIGMIYVP